MNACSTVVLYYVQLYEMQNNITFTLQKNCTLLACYAVSSGNVLPKFRDLYGSYLQGQESKVLSQNASKIIPLLAV